MKGEKAIFSSKSDEWTTPQQLFDELNQEFHFDLDAAADDVNHKCDRYFTAKQDGLTQNWGGVEYFAIHHTAILLDGLLKHFTRHVMITHLL